MSMIYWMNEGIGIRASDLYPHLDRHKCCLFVRSELPGEVIPEEGFDLEDYMGFEVYDNLGDFMCHVDDSGMMTYGDSGDGESYFLYPPSYPWCLRENEPMSPQAVHDIIVRAVLKVTNLTEEQAEALIDDDIYEYGCG